jgi:hypothetical protein
MNRISLASILVLSIGVSLAVSSPAFCICGTDVVIVKGTVDRPPHSAIVRVQLVYAKQRYGESGDVTVEDGKFVLQIPFFTQSRAPVLMGSLGEKCDRRPTLVTVKLMNGDYSQEIDGVSLDFKKDFKMSDPSAFAPRSEIVLRGIH